jgi:hypothetical protein
VRVAEIVAPEAERPMILGQSKVSSGIESETDVNCIKDTRGALIQPRRFQEIAFGLSVRWAGPHRSGLRVFDRSFIRSLRPLVGEIYRLFFALRSISGQGRGRGLRSILGFVSGLHLLDAGALDFCQVPSS